MFNRYIGLGVSSPAFVPLTMLNDEFDGTGAITSHIPNMSLGGSSWSIKNGAFGNLSGGEVPYSSGNYGVALINVAINNYKLTARFKAGNTHQGVIFRSNSAGSNRWLLQPQAGTNVQLLRSDALGSVAAWFDPTVITAWPTITNGTYYTFALLAYENQLRVLIDNIMYGYLIDSQYQSNTYVGLGCYLDPGAISIWDSLKVETITDWKKIAVIGDSMSSSGWPYIVMTTYMGGGLYHYVSANHAIVGATIMATMDDEVAEAASDDADIIFIELGTNDASDAGITAVYQAQVEALQISNPDAAIYGMSIFPKSGDQSARDANNPRIQAACANAGITYWDTNGWFDPATDTDDGLHPNDSGNAKVAAEVLARLP